MKIKDTEKQPIATKYDWRLDPYYIELKIEEAIKTKNKKGEHKSDEKF